MNLPEARPGPRPGDFRMTPALEGRQVTKTSSTMLQVTYKTAQNSPSKYVRKLQIADDPRGPSILLTYPDSPAHGVERVGIPAVTADGKPTIRTIEVSHSYNKSKVLLVPVTSNRVNLPITGATPKRHKKRKKSKAAKPDKPPRKKRRSAAEKLLDQAIGIDDLPSADTKKKHKHKNRQKKHKSDKRSIPVDDDNNTYQMVRTRRSKRHREEDQENDLPEPEVPLIKKRKKEAQADKDNEAGVGREKSEEPIIRKRNKKEAKVDKGNEIEEEPEELINKTRTNKEAKVAKRNEVEELINKKRNKKEAMVAKRNEAENESGQLINKKRNKREAKVAKGNEIGDESEELINKKRMKGAKVDEAIETGQRRSSRSFKPSSKLIEIAEQMGEIDQSEKKKRSSLRRDVLLDQHSRHNGHDADISIASPVKARRKLSRKLAADTLSSDDSTASTDYPLSRSSLEPDTETSSLAANEALVVADEPLDSQPSRKSRRKQYKSFAEKIACESNEEEFKAQKVLSAPRTRSSVVDSIADENSVEDPLMAEMALLEVEAVPHVPVIEAPNAVSSIRVDSAPQIHSVVEPAKEINAASSAQTEVTVDSLISELTETDAEDRRAPLKKRGRRKKVSAVLTDSGKVLSRTEESVVNLPSPIVDRELGEISESDLIDNDSIETRIVTVHVETLVPEIDSTKCDVISVTTESPSEPVEECQYKLDIATESHAELVEEVTLESGTYSPATVEVSAESPTTTDAPLEYSEVVSVPVDCPVELDVTMNSHVEVATDYVEVDNHVDNDVCSESQAEGDIMTESQAEVDVMAESQPEVDVTTEIQPEVVVTSDGHFEIKVTTDNFEVDITTNEHVDIETVSTENTQTKYDQKLTSRVTVDVTKMTDDESYQGIQLLKAVSIKQADFDGINEEGRIEKVKYPSKIAKENLANGEKISPVNKPKVKDDLSYRKRHAKSSRNHSKSHRSKKEKHADEKKEGSSARNETSSQIATAERLSKSADDRRDKSSKTILDKEPKHGRSKAVTHKSSSRSKSSVGERPSDSPGGQVIHRPKSVDERKTESTPRASSSKVADESASVVPHRPKSVDERKGESNIQPDTTSTVPHRLKSTETSSVVRPKPPRSDSSTPRTLVHREKTLSMTPSTTTTPPVPKDKVATIVQVVDMFGGLPPVRKEKKKEKKPVKKINVVPSLFGPAASKH